jgi:DNA repair exonuclease SbcCD nuclease subunit
VSDARPDNPNGRTDAAIRPLQIAHIADTHLGYSAYGKADPETGRNQRAVDIERAFEAAIDDILGRGVDLVLHAGDLFHHTRPSWSTLSHVVRQLRRVEQAGVPALVIAGNHDTPRLRTTGSVYALLALALPGIEFVFGYEAEERIFDRLGLMVHAVPHGALTNPDPPYLLPDATRRNVVVAHGYVAGVKTRHGREPGEEALKGNILDAGYDYVALGHEHLRTQAGTNAWYSGATERTSWGDQLAQPGFALVTLAGSVPHVEYVDLPARPMETLHPIDGDGQTARELADTILRRAAALDQPEAMVRVELRNTPRPLFRETEAIVRRETGDAAWHIRLTAPGDLLDPPGREGVIRLADLHPLALFDEFVKQRTDLGVYDGEFAARFTARGRAALEAALHRGHEATVGEDGGG